MWSTLAQPNLCSGCQVTRQLFEPLVMQLIHWFTNNKKFESQDTVAVLEAILVTGLLHLSALMTGHKRACRVGPDLHWIFFL